jgi:hypothetical protein
LIDWSSLPKPAGEPRLTRDTALIEAMRHLNVDPRRVDIEIALTTYAGAKRAMRDDSQDLQDPKASTWLVRFTGIFDNCAFGPCGPALIPPVTQPRLAAGKSSFSSLMPARISGSQMAPQGWRGAARPDRRRPLATALRRWRRCQETPRS